VNIDDRIERRLGYDVGAGVLVDIDAVSPMSHTESPVGRGPGIERLLDVFEPAFAGSLPPSAYVHGPKGSGKSAIVSALFQRLASHSGPRRAIQTSTRAVEPTLPGFVYVDARRAPTRFRLYHAALDAVSDDPVPEHGIGTDELAESLREAVNTAPDLVVAVDHANEPETPSATTIVEWLTAVSDRVVPVCLGREKPAAIEWEPDEVVAFEPYRRHVLVELLTSRCSTGLGRDALTHDQIREVSEWADGDTHDALAAVTGAAITAERAGASTVRPEDLDGDRGGSAPERRARAGPRALGEPAAAPLRTGEPVGRRPGVGECCDGDDRLAEGGRSVSVDGAARALRTRRRGPARSGDCPPERREGTAPSRLVPRFPTLVFQELFDRPSWSV